MDLIGLSGAKRSGKDTLAQMLVNERGYVKYSFAEPIKRMLLDLDPFLDGPISLAQLLDKFDGDWDKALNDRIHGAEVAYLLSTFKEKSLRNAFPEESMDSESVREMLFALDPRLAGSTQLSDVIDCEEDLEILKSHRRWGPETRQLMQRLGTDVMRDLYGPDVWVEHLANRIAHPKVVVADVRFNNEAEWVKKAGGEVHVVERSGLTSSFGSSHVSEAGISMDHVTHVLPNNGVDLEEFRHAAFTKIFATEDAK